jgi:hypothetical protein
VLVFEHLHFLRSLGCPNTEGPLVVGSEFHAIFKVVRPKEPEPIVATSVHEAAEKAFGYDVVMDPNAGVLVGKILCVYPDKQSTSTRYFRHRLQRVRERNDLPSKDARYRRKG